ncbi:hypothetical protein FE391_15490 [Nonomuraea sp. KC401]|uniref:hypothetical protein n=1 Tax=unclassified Nonomuraea TaxID=2593643 RepID=UPI0010FD6FE6|nr:MULTISPECIES: hypothetical protein [unclassified Nonomuraea]NBE95143.1 hypothetical protein [Nonomuraea sp. K271]TLF73401.1 hypothetical protein FE391_15490 [Nonomuraea sp. KC401]
MAMNDLLAEPTPFLGRICGPIALDSGQNAVQESGVLTTDCSFSLACVRVAGASRINQGGVTC